MNNYGKVLPFTYREPDTSDTVIKMAYQIKRNTKKTFTKIMKEIVKKLECGSQVEALRFLIRDYYQGKIEGYK